MSSIYGEFAVGEPGAIPVISGGHILGSRVRSAPNGDPIGLDVQWREAGGRIVQLELPWIQAMFLLSLLRSHQLDTGLPFPDDPRAPPKR